jgi:hypothetical protein
MYYLNNYEHEASNKLRNNQFKKGENFNEVWTTFFNFIKKN